MKTLRVVHGLTNNIVDLSVGDDFNMESWSKAIRADGGMLARMDDKPIWVNLRWIQHAVAMSPEEATLLYTGGQRPS